MSTTRIILNKISVPKDSKTLHLYFSLMSEEFDAIVILGGGLKEDLTLPIWVKVRVKKAIQVYKEQGSKYFILPTSSTPHVPIKLDNDGQPYNDSKAIAKELLENEIPKEKILMLDFARDTLGEAFFTRILFTDIRNLTKLCIITTKFQMPRAKHFFQETFALKPRIDYQLTFIESENIGITDEVLEMREQSEDNRVKNSVFNKRNIQTLADLHDYFCNGHLAYTPFAKQRELTDLEKKSY
ncbi:hypothetical protein CL619_00685 [archaeon]|nr:hypothetical protein [archaeon]|tara:strand:+ start:4036 stop:4758 length:723 start_codon:yes stop_codon:yes gene_type:complete